MSTSIPAAPPVSAFTPASIGMFVARALIAFIFLYEGGSKAVSYSAAAAYMQHFSVPPILLPAVLTLELGGGLALLAGLGVRYAALALSAFCVATAVLFHTKLNVTNEMLHFEKDLAIAGGLLALAIMDGRARPPG